MALPRHLWSGDWISDSARAADELARRREQGRPAPGREPAPAPAPVAPAGGRKRPRVTPAGVRAIALALLVVAIGAGVAIAVDAFSSGSRSVSSVPAPPPGAKPWLGLTGTVSPTGTGVLITQIAPGGPADQAGLRPGDVVTALNAQPLAAPSDLARVVDAQLIGAEVLLQIDRGGQLQTAGVTLVGRPAGAP